jgi:hypothetical protein
MPARLLTVVAAASALALGACGGAGKSTTTAAHTTQTVPGRVRAPGAMASFTSPRNNSIVGSTFTARVKLTKFILDAKAYGKAAKPGYGHLHFVLDEGKFDAPRYSGPNGKLAQKLGVVGTYSPSVKPYITYRGIPPGKHKLEVYLANNDHTSTGVEAATEFTVR